MKKKPDPHFPSPGHVKVYQFNQETIVVPKGDGIEVFGGKKLKDQFLPKSLVGPTSGVN